jgi:hypothetical protein
MNLNDTEQIATAKPEKRQPGQTQRRNTTAKNPVSCSAKAAQR